MTSEVELKELFEYSKILHEGVNKPDLAKSERSTTGTVRETKNLMPYIEAVHDEICKKLGINEDVDFYKARMEEEAKKIRRKEL